MYNRIKATNWTAFTVSLIVNAFLIMAAFISFTDIKTLAIRWGVPATLAWTAPLFIDGLTWMGKIGRSPRLDEDARRAGLALMIGGGLMSLAANVAVGETIGMRVYGALVVVGFVTAEWYSTKIRGVVKPQPAARPTSYVVTQAEKDARKAAGYDKKSATDKARWTMKYRARMAKQAATSTTP